MISFLAALLISIPGFSAISFGNGFVVGNGGDGYVVRGQIFLRDLLESGNSTLPEFGPISMPRHQERIRNYRWGFSFDQDLLARKIADLNTIYPFFGDAVLETLLQHNWIAVETPLSLLNEGENLIDLPPENLVQIANRLGSVIRVHLPSWDRLPKTHQIALLVHEALYSLVHLDCEKNQEMTQTCRPNVRKVREITGRLFLPHNHDSAIRLNAEIDVLFRLPHQQGKLVFQWNSSIVNFISLTSENRKISIFEDIGSVQSPRPLSSRVRSLCDRFLHLNGFEISPQLVHFEIDINHPQAIFFAYNSPFGSQQAVGWSLRGARSLTMRGLNKDTCERRLTLETARLQNPYLRFF